MNDVLRQRLMRRIESLPEDQVYQVLDFIEFLESKYARNLQAEASTLQRFAEGIEDRLRKKAMNPASLREAFQLIAAADRALSSVSAAGRQILTDLGSLAEGGEAPPPRPGGGRAVPGSTGTGSPRGTASGPPEGRGSRPPSGRPPSDDGEGEPPTP